MARALASLVFLKAGLFPLVVRDSDRQEYIGGLEVADSGDLGPLVGLFVRRQRGAILRALGLEAQVQQQRHAEVIIQSALQVLKGKHDAVAQQVSQVYACADALFKLADGRTAERFEIIVSLHGYGYGDTGLMAASAFTDRRIEREEGGSEYADLRPACIDLFQFNYAEPQESTVERFRDWLEGALAIGLAQWQRLIAA